MRLAESGASRLKLWPVRYDNLPVRSCFIDGEAIVVDESGLSVFELIRYRQRDSAAVLCAFDLIELNGKDLRRSPIEDRKTTLAELLRKKSDGIALNAHYEGDGANARGHCVEAVGITLSVWPGQRLAQDQEPSGASG